MCEAEGADSKAGGAETLNLEANKVNDEEDWCVRESQPANRFS